MPSSANQIAQLWNRLAGNPIGPRLFSRLIGRIVPYSGSIRANVLELRSGFARVEMKDRRAMRNHLNSIHAIALANLGELTSGLALNYGMPEHARAILTGISVEYLKKARGTLIAEASTLVPNGDVREELEVQTLIRDSTGETVSRVIARWLVSPREPET
jgi:acyl-coenzyme A thioesterase PaaI-like protein